jgi:hypothetical protein
MIVTTPGAVGDGAETTTAYEVGWAAGPLVLIGVTTGL